MKMNKTSIVVQNKQIKKTLTCINCKLKLVEAEKLKICNLSGVKYSSNHSKSVARQSLKIRRMKHS